MVDENASFEDNLKELEEIVANLEKGDVPLDDAIDEFKRAMDLVKACDEKLKDAENTIAKIVDDNGDVVEFDVE